MEVDLNFEDDLHLDKYKLDEACEQQASIYGKWAKLCAEAQSERDIVKDQFELKKAQLDSYCRENWNNISGGKLTEAAAGNWVITHPEYQEKLRELREAERILGILKVAENAIGQNKYMIQSAVQLYTSQYFAEPNTNTKDIGKEIKKEKKAMEVSRKMSQKLQHKMEKN